MGELRNEFSWSWSRHRTFQACRRRYWYAHYAFWGGWERDHPMREIYLQKRLSTGPQWVGIVVHEIAAWVLEEVRRGHYPPPERVQERAERLFRRQLDESARGLYRANPKRHPGLVEHYYDEAGATELSARVDDGVALVGRLFDNPVFLRLTRVPQRIQEVERLSQCTIEGVNVWVSPDALVQSEDGRFVIVDWKTGRAHQSDAVRAQLGVYASYVLGRYLGGADSVDAGLLARVETLYANVRSGVHERFTVDRALMDETRALVRESSGAMRELVQPGTDNDVEERDFPRLPEGDAECVRCAFRRACGRESGQ